MSFPEDVLVEILKRLPVRSLVKFRCVSKDWLRLISSHAFVCTHTLFTVSCTQRANLLLIGHSILGGGPQENFSLRFDDSSFAECRDLGTPLLGSCLQVNGYCHGLLCLSSSFDIKQTTVIWNPTLGISIALPEPSLKSSCDPFVGFGFDSKRNDYKVIRIHPFEDDDSRYELFELSRNAWRIVTPRVRPPPIYSYTDRVSLNGLAHWVGARSTIVAYSFSDEVFREMRLPLAMNDVDFFSVMICVKETSYLSVIHCCCDDPLVFRYYIWVMKEYGVEKSWSKLFNVHPPYLQSYPALFGFRTNGELLARMKYDELVSFDSCTNAVTSLGYNDHSWSPITFVGDHIETLVLLQVPGGERKL